MCRYLAMYPGWEVKWVVKDFGERQKEDAESPEIGRKKAMDKRELTMIRETQCETAAVHIPTHEPA